MTLSPGQALLAGGQVQHCVSTDSLNSTSFSLFWSWAKFDSGVPSLRIATYRAVQTAGPIGLALGFDGTDWPLGRGRRGGTGRTGPLSGPVRRDPVSGVIRLLLKIKFKEKIVFWWRYHLKKAREKSYEIYKEIISKLIVSSPAVSYLCF